MNVLNAIQLELVAPKDQLNKFARYKFRNVEGILEAVKPLLEKYNCTINLTDELVLIGEADTRIIYDMDKEPIKGEYPIKETHSKGRFYIKATATLSHYDPALHKLTDADGKSLTNIMTNEWSATAYARESDNKKGFDDAQNTGACSSYARKYALSGLLIVDGGEDDADATNDHGVAKKKTARKKKPEDENGDDHDTLMARQNHRLMLGHLMANNPKEYADIPYVLTENIKTIGEFHAWSVKNPTKGKIVTFENAIGKVQHRIKMDASEDIDSQPAEHGEYS